MAVAEARNPTDRRWIVRIHEITKRFPGPSRDKDVLALDRVTLQIADGEFLALLGPSGCGKSTLLRILAGLESATTGQVAIDGHIMTGVPPDKRPVNMVFQRPALFPHLNVYENIAFGPRMAGVPPGEIAERVRKMLALVRLEGYEERRVTQLSGGQAQRVALARGLINQPKVLLLDEPLSALDLKLRKAMQLELKAIHRLLGTTFIYVTHDQEEAMTMADRIVIMDRGLIVQDGTPREIYHRPSTRFASQFIGDSNVLPARVTACGGDRLLVDVSGFQVAAIGPEDVRVGQSVWLAIRPEKVSVHTDRAADQSNQFTGEIVDTIFLGALVRYEIGLSEGLQIAAVESLGDDHRLLSPGATVHVSWRPDQCLVLTG